MQPYSPYSIRGIAGNVGGAYDAARGAVTNAFEGLHNTFGTPVGYTPALASPAPVPAAVPAPVPAPMAIPTMQPQLGGMNLSVIQRREQAAGLKNGGPVSGMVSGPGTGISDSIPTAMSPGSYVLPADSTQDVKTPVDVSNGETALSPDQVHAVGQAALDAVRGVTHKTVRMPKRRGKANGGPVSRLAGGGPVDDQASPVRTMLRPAGSQLASQIPTDGYGNVPASDGSNDSVLSGTAGQVLDTVNAVAPALGPQGAAVARLATGAVNAGRVVSTIAAGSKLAPLVPVAAGYGALVSASTPPAAPAAAAPPAAAAATNPTDQRLAQGGQAAPVPDPTAAGAPPQDTGIPGVHRFVDASGRVLFTDNAAGAVPAAGGISPQNSAAADNLSDRYGAQARAQASGPSAAALPAGYGITTPADTGGYGILDKGYQTARTASIDNADAAQLASKLGRSGAQVLSAGMGNQAAIAETGMREAGSTGRTEIGETGQTQRERENNAAMLQREGPTRFLTNMEQATKLRGSIALMAAQDSYRQALAGGDPTKVQQAEDALRAAQGHWERNFPELYSTTAIPAQINADGSRTSPGAIVTDKRTGQVKIVGADQWGGGQQPQTMPTDKAKLVAGQTYQTARGPARWDGNQFVQ